MESKKHIFHAYGAITSAFFSTLKSQILQAIQQNASELIIYLSSEGGDLTTGFTAYNFLRGLPISLTIINMGRIESIAVIMFLAADKRYAVETSRFMLHEFHWNFINGQINQSRVAEYVKSLEYDKNMYKQIFNERLPNATKINIDNCLNGNTLILSPSSAKDSGIIIDIIPVTGTIQTTDIHWWIGA